MPARGGSYNGMCWIRMETRWAIYWRDRDQRTGDLRCLWCLKVYRPGVVRLSLDHLTPWVRGGSNAPSNLVTSCLRCNSRRRASVYDPLTADVEVSARIEAVRYSPIDRSVGKSLWLAYKWSFQLTPPALVYSREYDDSDLLRQQKQENIAAGRRPPDPPIDDPDDLYDPDMVPF